MDTDLDIDVEHQMPETDELYGADYYRSHCGPIPYDRSHPHWLEFFGKIADELVRLFRPKTVFDAGCAHGFLLESFWDRGVEAHGRDVSEFAISQIRADVRSFCAVDSIAAPIQGRFDLVTCIEVVEHMPAEEGRRAIAAMTAAADRIVFSSSPDDLTEPTHINVKPPIYWMRLFAEHGFRPAITITIPTLTPYAMVFERSQDEADGSFLLACAEIIRGRMKLAEHYHRQGALTGTIAQQEQSLSDSQSQLRQRDELIAARDEALHELRSERDAQTTEVLQARDEVSVGRRAAWNAEQALTASHRLVDSLKQQLEAITEQHRHASVHGAAETSQLRAQVDALSGRAHAAEQAASVAQIEYHIVISSTTWRSMAAVRKAARRLPAPIRVTARRALKLVYWSATLQLGRRIRARRRAQDQLPSAPISLAAAPAAELLPLAASAPHVPAPQVFKPVASYPDWFDADFYLRNNADVAAAGAEPLAHYLDHGRVEGRLPSARAAQEAQVFVLADFCNVSADEPGPRTFDPAFRVTVLTPVYNIAPSYLGELYQTLRNQHYSNWEWVVVDDGSPNPETVAALRRIADADARVELIASPTNLGISGASNIALKTATGAYVALVDHDDLLARTALLDLYEAWRAAPETELFFTDECKLLPDGQVGQFWPKPDWSPAYLENTMCIGHLAIYRADFLRAIGGFRSEFDGTQDYELALRASLANPKVVHLSKFSYLWRVIPGSGAVGLDQKQYAVDRMRRAVLDYAHHKHPQATVTPSLGDGYWRINYPLPEPPPLLTFIILTSFETGPNNEMHVERCIRDFESRGFYPKSEYLLVHAVEPTAEQREVLEREAGVRLVSAKNVSVSRADQLNFGAAAALGDFLYFVSEDCEALTEQGGEALVSYLAANPAIGAIGPKVLNSDGTLQQNGILLTERGPMPAGAGQSARYGGHQEMLHCRRECFCLDAGALLVSRTTFAELGGFDIGLPPICDAADFSIRLRAAARSSVVDPYVVVSRPKPEADRTLSAAAFQHLLLKHPTITDPYFSRWFDQSRSTFRLELRPKAMASNFGARHDRHVAARAMMLVPAARPRLSVCVSVYDQPRYLLEEMFRSVELQTYAETEIVVFDNGSTNPETLAWLDHVRADGKAIVDRVEVNIGIEGGNRRLLDRMSGDFFVALDADDFLDADALQIMAHAIGAHPDRHLFFSDEYKSDVESARFSPFYKPDFDPVLLMNCCYPAHLMAMRADFLRKVGAYNEPRAAWSHDYDTLTRALAVGEEPVHVRELTYAWRINPGSTASAATSGKPEATASQRFVLDRLLAARGLAGTLYVEPNTLETSSGMWRLRAREPVPGIHRLDADEVWGRGGVGIAGLIEAARNAAWVAILVPGDRDGALLELSAPAWLDPRVCAVSGIFLDPANTVRWSGGLFAAGGRAIDPYADLPLSNGGYHGQLWCQRCIDVPAPIQVLLRSDVLLDAATRPQIADADGLVATLGRRAHENRNLIVTTPHVRRTLTPPMQALLTLDRAGRLRGEKSLEDGGRWYNGALAAEPPYYVQGPSQ